MELLRQWINGRGKQPVTWKTLAEVLHDIELSILAREIEVLKCHEETIGQARIPISDHHVEKDVLIAKTTEESEQSSTRDVHTEGMEDVKYSESIEQVVDITADLLPKYFECEDSEEEHSLLDRNFEAAIDCEDLKEKEENQRTSASHGTGRMTDTRSLSLIQDEELD